MNKQTLEQVWELAKISSQNLSNTMGNKDKSNVIIYSRGSFCHDETWYYLDDCSPVIELDYAHSMMNNLRGYIKQ